jgi:hypothetical protein
MILLTILTIVNSLILIYILNEKYFSIFVDKSYSFHNKLLGYGIYHKGKRFMYYKTLNKKIKIILK